MIIPDETLMAYADGELDGEARAAVERAMEGDPAVARRVERYRTLRNAVRAAYDPVILEPVPERLVDAARTAPAEQRSAVVALRGARPASGGRGSAKWWLAIAASLIVGALASTLVLRSLQSTPFALRNGRLIARTALARALTTQLASHQAAAAPIAIGITFLAKSGGYCRTFTLRGRSALAGLACRDDGQWQIEALARSEPRATSAGTYRQAASPIPPAILATASAEMAGEPLDARGEAAARAHGWRR